MALEDVVALALDPEGDFIVEEDEFGNKSFRTLQGEDAVRQGVQNRVLSLLGERVLHPTYGLDFPKIERRFDEALLRGEIVRAILESPDIEAIVDITIEFDGRTRRASFFGTVRLKDGELVGIDGVA